MKRMTKETELICIICPLAYHIMVTTDNSGNILNLTNHQFKGGREYRVGLGKRANFLMIGNKECERR
jgi:CxxC motif-containing protein